MKIKRLKKQINMIVSLASGKDGKISFNPIVTEAMVNGKPIIRYSPRSDVVKEIEGIWGKAFSINIRGEVFYMKVID